MTPPHLHALAAAWSLHTARQHLAQHAADEAAQIAAERLNAADGLRSPTWGTRHASGGHGDPVSTLLLAADRPARVNRWAELDQRVTGKLAWLADTIHGEPRSEPLSRIRATIPHLQPGTAAVVAKHLADEDRWIREAVGVGPTRAPLLGIACPACAHRELYVQVAGPEDAWTVMCAGRWDGNRRNPCLCVGEGCPCGMEGAVEGVAHIWPRAAVIAGAVAGAAPTTTTN